MCLRDFVSEGDGYFHTSHPSEMAGVTSGEHSLVPKMDSMAVWEEGGGLDWAGDIPGRTGGSSKSS